MFLILIIYNYIITVAIYIQTTNFEKCSLQLYAVCYMSIGRWHYLAFISSTYCSKY